MWPKSNIKDMGAAWSYHSVGMGKSPGGKQGSGSCRCVAIPPFADFHQHFSIEPKIPSWNQQCSIMARTFMEGTPAWLTPKPWAASICQHSGAANANAFAAFIAASGCSRTRRRARGSKCFSSKICTVPLEDVCKFLDLLNKTPGNKSL